MCFLDCCILIIFFWIICPIFCCWAYCKGKELQTSLMAALALKLETYERIYEIGSKANINKARINVTDLALNDDKIGQLRQFIEKSGVMELYLKNDGLPVEEAHSDYSKFRATIMEITKIQGLKYDIEWAQIKLQN